MWGPHFKLPAKDVPEELEEPVFFEYSDDGDGNRDYCYDNDGDGNADSYHDDICMEDWQAIIYKLRYFSRNVKCFHIERSWQLNQFYLQYSGRLTFINKFAHMPRVFLFGFFNE